MGPVVFSLERETVRFFKGMQSDYFNIFRRRASVNIAANHPPCSAHLSWYLTTRTTKDSNLWMKTLRFMLP